MSTGIPEKLFGDFVFVNFLPKTLRKNMPEGQEGQRPLRGLNLGAAKRLLGEQLDCEATRRFLGSR